jgi:16S rRNA (cytosine967-C5)-methyltransferase
MSYYEAGERGCQALRRKRLPGNAGGLAAGDSGGLAAGDSGLSATDRSSRSAPAARPPALPVYLLTCRRDDALARSPYRVRRAASGRDRRLGFGPAAGARRGLDSRDAGLASEIVFGVLRYRAQLDFLIEHYAGRGRSSTWKSASRSAWASISSATWSAFRRMRPSPRAVDLVKRARKRSAAGFVNAILRQVDRAPVAWPNREVDFVPGVAAGPLGAAVRGTRKPPPASRARRSRAGKVHARDAHFQDIGAQASCRCSGWRAGPELSRSVRGSGQQDRAGARSGRPRRGLRSALHRLARMKNLDARAGGARWHPAAAVGAPLRPHPGGRALLRHRARWGAIRSQVAPRPDDLTGLQGRQIALLRHALAALAPGGLLVYSTCSLEPEENEEVVAEARPGRAWWPRPCGGFRGATRGRFLRRCDKIGIPVNG